MIKLTIVALLGLWVVGLYVLRVPSGTLGILSVVVLLAALALGAWRSERAHRAVEGSRNRALASEREFRDSSRRNRGD